MSVESCLRDYGTFCHIKKTVHSSLAYSHMEHTWNTYGTHISTQRKKSLHQYMFCHSEQHKMQRNERPYG